MSFESKTYYLLKIFIGLLPLEDNKSIIPKTYRISKAIWVDSHAHHSLKYRLRQISDKNDFNDSSRIA